jgi:hypothetical protein
MTIKLSACNDLMTGWVDIPYTESNMPQHWKIPVTPAIRPTYGTWASPSTALKVREAVFEYCGRVDVINRQRVHVYELKTL